MMEGFCRMLHYCEDYERDVLQYNSHHLASCVLDSFYALITSENLTEEEIDIILESPLPLEVHVGFVNSVNGTRISNMLFHFRRES